MPEKNQIILAVDTSAKKHSISILENEVVLDTETGIEGESSSEKLLSDIKKILEKNNFSLTDVDLIAASVGPGSFTGLKVGLSIVKGITLGTNIKVTGISVLESIAAICGKGKNIISIVQGGKDKYYVGHFSRTDEFKAEKTHQTIFLNLQQLLEEIALNTESVIVCSSELEGILKPQIDCEIIPYFAPLSEFTGQRGFQKYCESSESGINLTPEYL